MKAKAYFIFLYFIFLIVVPPSIIAGTVSSSPSTKTKTNVIDAPLPKETKNTHSLDKKKNLLCGCGLALLACSAFLSGLGNCANALNIGDSFERGDPFKRMANRHGLANKIERQPYFRRFALSNSIASITSVALLTQCSYNYFKEAFKKTNPNN